MSKDSREITRTTRLPAWPGLSSRRGSRIFYWGPKLSIFTIDDFPQEEDQTLLHVLRLMQWVFIWIEHFIPGPSSPFSYSWSFFSSAQLNCHWKEHQASERFWRLRETFCWSSLLRSHPNRWMSIIVMEGSNLWNSVIIIMGHCHGSSLSWRGQIYITGSWLLATSPCHENHPSLAEGDTKTIRIHNFFH